MGVKKLDKMMADMNARLDEMERRTQVEEEAYVLVSLGKYEEAIKLMNTLDDSLLELGR